MAILPGTRIRDNGVLGTITDNPLTAGATTFNSAGLAQLSVVSGNHALVTLDPLEQFGQAEIVMVTAHTAAATVATIQRGMFGTVARSHPVNTLWVHAACDNDFEEIVTSSTRPSDQYAGQVIYETDTLRTMRHNGAAWLQDGLLFDPPTCRVFHSVNISIPNNTETAIPNFDSEGWDTDNMHSGVNPGRVTFNTAGVYSCVFNFEFETNGIGFRNGTIRRNGSNKIAYVSTNAANITFGVGFCVNTIFKFAAGDYIEGTVFQNSGGSLNVTNFDSISTELTVCYLGRGN